MAHQSEYTKTLNKLQSLVHKELKTKGFQRKGRTHNRILNDGIVHVINFQSGEFPVGDNYVIPGVRESLYGKFTVNLGVFVPDIYEVTNGHLKQGVIQEYFCQIRTRLAELAMGNDYWWPIVGTYPQVANVLISYLNGEGEKWFSNFSTKEKTIESLQDKTIRNLCAGVGKLNAALIQLNINRKAGEALLKEHYQLSKDHKGHQEYVLGLANKVGIVIN